MPGQPDDPKFGPITTQSFVDGGRLNPQQASKLEKIKPAKGKTK